MFSVSRPARASACLRRSHVPAAACNPRAATSKMPLPIKAPAMLHHMRLPSRPFCRHQYQHGNNRQSLGRRVRCWAQMDAVSAVLEQVGVGPAGQSAGAAVRVRQNGAQGVQVVATTDLPPGQVALEVNEQHVVTAVDARTQPTVGAVAEASSELVALALWLLAERANGPRSRWARFLSTLPEASPSPLLWRREELEQLLQGCSVVAEAEARRQALEQQWAELEQQHFSQNREVFHSATYGLEPFLTAFAVVLAHVAYLPSARCFALVPGVCLLPRTGNQNGCTLDYHGASGTVRLIPRVRVSREQPLMLEDERPNSEMFLSTGAVQDGNQSDFLLFRAELVAADRYHTMKAEMLRAAGLSPAEDFPVYLDRMPAELLNYLRLSRIQDPALFAKVSFDQDRVINNNNEYEVLQLVMGDCRDRLAAFSTSLEDDIKMLQSTNLDAKARLAARLRLSEKQILSATMNAVRRRLAPIRGIPTKSGGMSDPNQDIKDIFDAIESLPSRPKQLFSSIFGGGDKKSKSRDLR